MGSWNLTAAELASLAALCDEDESPGESPPADVGADVTEARLSMRYVDRLLELIQTASPTFTATSSISELVAIRERATAGKL
jgi:hypothetical protein